jgi:enoyl-CoA hydratase/carnithine racemase
MSAKKTKDLDSIKVTEESAKSGQIGRILLNSEKTLNSLTLEMVDVLLAKLKAWKEDKSIALIVLEGAGEKAFCAGGDVQKLHESATQTPGGPCDYAEQFFLHEYQLNYLIHTYPKPIVCIGKGIVMGGGLGLMAGASHRIVSENTRIAMPEITIGLFPDVGGTYFLNKMPNALGIFFGLTGAPINASDALHTQLADAFIPTDKHAQFLDELLATAWSLENDANTTLLDNCIANHSAPLSVVHHEVPSHLLPHLHDIENACRQTSLGEIIAHLKLLELESKWFSKALATLSEGSPVSMLVIYEQLKRFRYAELPAVFSAELILGTNLVRYPEFAEGVRALLIDKDRKPKWQYPHFSAIPASVLEHFFTAPWEINPISTALSEQAKL